MTVLIALFLLFDGIIHILNIAPVAAAFAQLGFPVNVAVPLGIVELICLVLYVIPQTSVLGAILLTGYLGGAVATNLRVGASLFGTILFPVYMGILLWGGLYLRDGRLRALIPSRKN
jgi:DoxX-like family